MLIKREFYKNYAHRREFYKNYANQKRILYSNATCLSLNNSSHKNYGSCNRILLSERRVGFER